MGRVDSTLLAALLRQTADLLERGELAQADGDPWIAQDESPLGRRAHTRAVRSGELTGCRVGRRVLVRRSELDAYIERHRVAPATDDDDSDDGELSPELAAAMGE